ncbi:hypothetical protein Hanom_Chr04g00324331 [Helianthus anomalus]
MLKLDIKYSFWRILELIKCLQLFVFMNLPSNNPRSSTLLWLMVCKYQLLLLNTKILMHMLDV